jgi:hypothetical protein
MRNVGLLSLSCEQMRDFAVLQGVSDHDALLADIRQREAEEFAERPQDLIELCSDWRGHHRIRTHRERPEPGGGQGRDYCERMDRALVEHSEDDVDGNQGREDQDWGALSEF